MVISLVKFPLMEPGQFLETWFQACFTGILGANSFVTGTKYSAISARGGPLGTVRERGIWVWGCRMARKGLAHAGPWNYGAWRALFQAALIGYFTTFSSLAIARNIIVISNDRGGAVTERIALIRQYRNTGTRVELRGDYCLSACTLYLALPETCVAPRTVFGFHGPSSRLYGVALTQTGFDRWSRAMADYYPEPLRSWFMATARYRVVGFYELSGEELIDMGFRRCDG